MKQIVRICTLMVFLALIVNLTMTAYAAEASVTYEGSAQKFIFEPGSDDSPTDLFPGMKDIMPGDSITQKI